MDARPFLFSFYAHQRSTETHPFLWFPYANGVTRTGTGRCTEGPACKQSAAGYHFISTPGLDGFAMSAHVRFVRWRPSSATGWTRRPQNRLHGRGHQSGSLWPSAWPADSLRLEVRAHPRLGYIVRGFPHDCESASAATTLYR